MEYHDTPAALKAALRAAKKRGDVHKYAEIHGKDDTVVVGCTEKEMLRYLDAGYNGGWSVCEMVCPYHDGTPYTVFTLGANNH